MVFPFGEMEVLIFSDPSISNFCKSWVMIKVQALQDDQLRINLWANGSRNWHFVTKGDVDDPFYLHDDWFLNEPGNMLNKDQKEQEFKAFLDHHWNSTMANNWFHVVNHGPLGLGLISNENVLLSNMADEIPGYLEYISEELFFHLHTLGYNSLFTYKDRFDVTHWCILYGPLSLVNASPVVDVGFKCLDTDGRELLYEHTFEFGQEDVHIDHDISAIDDYSFLVEAEYDRYLSGFYRGTLFTFEPNPAPPVLSVTRKKELFVRVKMNYFGALPGWDNESRVTVKGREITINYDWRNPNILDNGFHEPRTSEWTRD